MNYISKTVFKQILPQFLQIGENSLEMEQGVLRLGSGQLKPSKIDSSLKSHRFRLASSKYEQILIEIPWFEFSSKAVRLSVDKMEIQLQRLDEMHEATAERPPTSQRSSKSYLQSFLSKLAFNMELAIKDFLLVVKFPREGFIVEMAIFNISLRNSNLFYEESTNIRKTMSIGTWSLKVNGEQLLLINDINFCVDYDVNIFKILIIIGRFSQSISTDLLTKLTGLIPKKRQARIKQQSKKNDPSFNRFIVFFKIEEYSMNLTLKNLENIDLRLQHFQVDYELITSSQTKKELKVVLQNLTILWVSKKIFQIYNSCDDKSTQKDLFLTYQNHQERMVRGVQIHVVDQQKEQEKSLTMKMYHIGVLLNVCETQKLFQKNWCELDELRKRFASNNEQIEPVVSQSIAPGQSLSEQSIQLTSNQSLIIVAYKINLQVWVEGSDITFFITVQYFSDKLVKKLMFRQLDVFFINAPFIKVYGFNLSVTGNENVIYISSVKNSVNNRTVKTFQILKKSLSNLKKSLQVTNKQISKQKFESDKQIDKISKQSCFIIIDEIQINLGTYIEGLNKQNMVRMIDLNINQFYLKTSSGDVTHSNLRLQLFYIDQQTLHQQRISNLIEVCYKIRENSEKIIEFRNHIKMRIEPKQLISINRLLNSQCPFITITNYCKYKIRILQLKTEIDIECKRSQYWFLSAKTFKVQYCDMLSEQIALELEAEIEKSIKFPNGKLLIVKLRKRQDGNNQIIIKSPTYVLNCFADLGIIHRTLNMELNIKKCDYLDEGFNSKNQNHIFAKAEDFEEFGYFFSDSHLQDLSIYCLGRQHTLELMLQKQKQCYYAVRDIQTKTYSAYILSQHNNLNTLFMVMPFLQVHNDTDLEMNVTIVEKKTQLQYKTTLSPASQIIPDNRQSFDFYMKQFVVQVTAVFQKDIYASEQYYFSSFAFVNEPIERIIPLRNTSKNKYDKKHICIKETVKLRTKFLEFSCGVTIKNNSSYEFVFNIQQRGQTNPSFQAISMKANSSTPLSAWLRQGDIVIISYDTTLQAKIIIQVSALQQSRKLLSFNFCKKGQAFKNILVSLDLEKQDSGQVLLIQNFITITNLTKQNLWIDGKVLNQDEMMTVDLPPNLSNEYNNKAIKLIDLPLEVVYKNLFDFELPESLHQRVFEIKPSCTSPESINLFMFIKQTIFEVMQQPQKKVLRLLKELGKRINFYVIEDLYSQDLKYTVVSNHTKQHFLISQELTFQGIFQFDNQQQQLPHNAPHPPKTLISPNTSSIISRHGDYSTFLCDSRGEKLNQLKKNLLDKMSFQYEKNTFGSVIAIQFGSKPKLLNDQFRIKQFELIIGHEDQDLVVITIQGLNVRRLDNNKVDVLLRQFSIRDAKLNYTIFSLSEESYMILECSNIHHSILLIKNMFLKMKGVTLDIRKDFFVGIIKLYKSMLRESKEIIQPTKQQIFIGIVKSKLFLVKNIFIDEFDVKISIEMESIELNNQLQIGAYKLQNVAYRHKKLMASIEKFYSSALISKFPKLSFIIQNFKHPLSAIKSLFSLRQSLKYRQNETLNYKQSKYSQWSVEKALQIGLGNLKPNESILSWLRITEDCKLILTHRQLILLSKTNTTSIQADRINTIKFQTKRGQLIAQLQLEGQLLELPLGRRRRCGLIHFLNQVIL